MPDLSSGILGSDRVKLKSLLFDAELTKAYSVLSNLNSRREYDKEIGAYFTMRSTKKQATGEKVLRLTDEMLEIDMNGIREVHATWMYCKISFNSRPTTPPPPPPPLEIRVKMLTLSDVSAISLFVSVTFY